MESVRLLVCFRSACKHKNAIPELLSNARRYEHALALGFRPSCITPHFATFLVLAQTTFVNRSRATFGLNVPLEMPRISSAGGRERQQDAISAAAKPRCPLLPPESYKRSRVITLKRSKDRDAPQKADKSTLGVGCRRPSRQTRCPLIPLVKPEPQPLRKDTHLPARNTALLSSWISSLTSPLCFALAFCNFELVARDI